MKHYHYIFTGSGLSALMTVYKMALSEQFSDKSILLIDKDIKKTNDRTWCFWETKSKNWEKIIHKKWDSAIFANEDFRRNLDLSPFRYNTIRGLDFYNLIFEVLSKHKNITFVQQNVIDFQETKGIISVNTETETYSCSKLFNSIIRLDEVENQTKYPLIKQHFIGWFIKAETPIFDSKTATFMDFSVNQKGNTRFMYVLPTSETEALIEYTLFSHRHLDKSEYEEEIQKYIQKLGVIKFEIVEKEQGSIPMTCFPFWKKNTKNILNIGSIGGWTKASTGYTFKNADKKSGKLIQFLSNESDFRKFHSKNKFWYYDLLLLNILDRNNELGSIIFSALFKKGNPALVLKFLDEETSLFEDIQVIMKCPKRLFIKALFRVLFSIKNNKKL
jgi:lycopene beta-cyclase